MAEVLRQGFEPYYGVSVVFDGGAAVRQAQAKPFAAIVLDLMLPVLDGFEVTTTLRAQDVRTPILMLTARDGVEDVVRGFDCGIEDYLVKPFSFLELLARVKALVRRGGIAAPDTLCAGDIRLRLGANEVFRGQEQVHLTRTEFLLLEVLMRNQGRVVQRTQLVRAGWGESAGDSDNRLDVTMSSLRKKVDPQRGALQTVRGFGYKLAPTL